jgi:hypothetical protein
MNHRQKIQFAWLMGTTAGLLSLTAVIFGAIKIHDHFSSVSPFYGLPDPSCPLVTRSYTPGDSSKHDCYTSSKSDIDRGCHYRPPSGRCFTQLFTLVGNHTLHGMTRLFKVVCIAACNGGLGRLEDFMHSPVFPTAPEFDDYFNPQMQRNVIMVMELFLGLGASLSLGVFIGFWVASLQCLDSFELDQPVQPVPGGDLELPLLANAHQIHVEPVPTRASIELPLVPQLFSPGGLVEGAIEEVQPCGADV